MVVRRVGLFSANKAVASEQATVSANAVQSGDDSASSNCCTILGQTVDAKDETDPPSKGGLEVNTMYGMEPWNQCRLMARFLRDGRRYMPSK